MFAPRRSEPTVLFCLGANKAGTTWLYNYLARHPQCRLPSIKELHYFDAYSFGRLAAERARIADRRSSLADDLANAEGSRAKAKAAQLQEIDDWAKVIAQDSRDDDAYRSFLFSRTKDARLVADVTPAYALLPEPVLAQMQALAKSVRFLYILRDPIDRLWSNIRMNAARIAANADQLATHAFRMFDAWAEGGEGAVAKRSDYQGTLARLASAVLPAGLRVEFYERLFTTEAIDRLCAFLGLKPHPADFSQAVHAGVAVPLDAARHMRARQALAPQYEYVRQTIGDLPPRWRDNMGGF